VVHRCDSGGKSRPSRVKRWTKVQDDGIQVPVAQGEDWKIEDDENDIYHLPDVEAQSEALQMARRRSADTGAIEDDDQEEVAEEISTRRSCQKKTMIWQKYQRDRQIQEEDEEEHAAK
jgi:diphthamide synthase (EF-2-diphthine--ammonia ligase)